MSREMRAGCPRLVCPDCDYTVAMILVNVAKLKEQLSHYLKLASRGEEVVVTSHRHRVARILPPSTPGLGPTRPSRPVKDLRRLTGVKARRGVTALGILLEDRRRR